MHFDPASSALFPAAAPKIVAETRARTGFVEHLDGARHLASQLDRVGDGVHGGRAQLRIARLQRRPPQRLKEPLCLALRAKLFAHHT